MALAALLLGGATSARAEGLPPGCNEGALGGRRALLVGVGRIASDRADEGGGWPPLRGTTHDVEAMAALLRDQAFAVRCLLDEQASKAAIVAAFEGLIAEAGETSPPEVAVFYFAGHGQRLVDDGDDETDRCDEAIVPFDSRGPTDAKAALRDDDLGELLAVWARRADHVLAIFDSCYSGTLTRGGAPTRGLGRAAPGACRVPSTRGIDPLSTGLSELPVTVLTAASERQRAHEYRDPVTGRYAGAFTRVLVDSLRRAARSGRTHPLTYGELVQRVAGRIPEELNQTPTFEGSAEQEVLSGALLPRPNSFPVDPLPPRGLGRVGAGRVHGLAPGALLAFVEPELPAPRPFLLVRTATGLEANVDLVDAERAPLTGSARALSVRQLARGSRARLHEPPPTAPIRVHLAPRLRRTALAKVLTEALTASPSVVGPIADGDAWDLAIRPAPRAPGRTGPGRGRTGGVRLIASSGAGLPLPSRPGRPPVPGASGSGAEAGRALAAGIRAWEARTRLLELAPGPGEDGLRFDARVVTVRHPRCRSPSGGASGAVLRLQPGQCFGVEIANRDTVPIHLLLLGLGPDLSIVRLAGGLGGREARVDEGRTARLRWTGKAALPAGVTTLLVLATEGRPIDGTAFELVPGDLWPPGGGSRTGQTALERMLADRATGRRGAAGGGSLARWGTAALRIRVSDQ